MRKLFALMLVVMAIWATSVAQEKSAQDKKVDAAVKAAQAWLATIDAGNYGASWEQSSEMFKSKITNDKWSDAMRQYRAPLGTMAQRKLWGSQFKDSVPGAPAGEYVIMQFNTNFENKTGAVETVTMALDKDGKWRAAGYYIR